jgi:hypothetical protein
MENKLIFELEQQLTDIDIDSIKLDAVIQLKTWEQSFFSLIEKIYVSRLNEINSIASDITNEIHEKQTQLEQINIKDKTALLELQNEIDQLKSNIIINQTIPDDFHHLIERTIRIKRDENHDDEDDDFVIIDIDKNEPKTGEQLVIVLAPPPPNNSESCVSKILHSEPIQQALTAGLIHTLTHVGTVAATSTTTIAATTMAKTALLTTACGLSTMAYGMGMIALGTTKKVWSLVIKSDNY